MAGAQYVTKHSTVASKGRHSAAHVRRELLKLHACNVPTPDLLLRTRTLSASSQLSHSLTACSWAEIAQPDINAH